MFKELLAKFREERRLYKSDVAKKLSVTAQYYGSLERGSNPPPNVDMCNKIASALDLAKEEKDSLIMASIEERLDEQDLGFIKKRLGTYPSTQAINDVRKAVIRITSRGNAEIVSRDPGMSISIQFEDEEDGIIVPMTKHKIDDIKTDKSRIPKHVKT